MRHAFSKQKNFQQKYIFDRILIFSKHDLIQRCIEQVYYLSEG